MRRTVLSALALGSTIVLAGTVPAFADGPSPVPSTRPGAAAPAGPSPVPATRSSAPSAVPSAAPTRVNGRGQVSVVPKGAPDTGVTAVSSSSGSEGGLIGGGAAAALVAGGAAVFAVRRRRATGA
ncbi:sortase-dependent protein [Streptomyces sp. NPDC057062]|uniref:sortase-dependent protein n=1 Tax=Streptomyces sp. NPDC057062 TaxID=3346011 RepID=UPI0036404E09